MLLSLNFGESPARAANQDKSCFFSYENSAEINERLYCSRGIFCGENMGATTLHPP